MKKRKLFYKDLSGLRFVGMVCIFMYVIIYILFDQESSQISKNYFSFSASLKNIGISLFFIVSSFLLTAHGLRECKYNESFNLKHFYLRRLLKILPVLVIALFFYVIAHPAIVSTLKLNPLVGNSSMKALIFFPEYRNSIGREIRIYAYFIYLIIVLLQYYALWGLVLKYLRTKLSAVLSLLLLVGIAFKIIGDSDVHPYYLYLPFYFVEIGIGAFTALVIRGDSSMINTIKTMSGTKILSIYFFGAITALGTYVLFDSDLFRLITKLCIYLVFAFYILEQTFAKHSVFKARNSLFIIQFGNLSYSFVMFLPIVSIIILIALESVEIKVNSNVIMAIYPVLCLIVTWLASYFFHNYISRFFKQISKEYKQ